MRPTNDIKSREEQKRDRVYDPLQRWRHLQETMTWAESNMAPHLRRNRPRRPSSYFSESTANTEREDQPGIPTLARKLGDIAHVSGLAIRLARLSGAGDRLPEWLLKAAVERGAKHYQRDFDASLPPDKPAISDEEIGVALCLGQMPDNPWFIRAAAQLLSSPRVDPIRLAWLAEMERVEPVLLHIAAAAERVDSALEPWATLRRLLHPRRRVRTDALPHWTRFAVLQGLTRHGYAPPAWLQRDE